MCGTLTIVAMETHPKMLSAVVRLHIIESYAISSVCFVQLMMEHTAMKCLTDVVITVNVASITWYMMAGANIAWRH